MVVDSGRGMVFLSSTSLSISRSLCICTARDTCGATVASSNQCTATSAAILVFLCCCQWLLSLCAFVSRQMATRAGYSTCYSSRDVAWCTTGVCATSSSGPMMNRMLAEHQCRIISSIGIGRFASGMRQFFIAQAGNCQTASQSRLSGGTSLHPYLTARKLDSVSSISFSSG